MTAAEQADDERPPLTVFLANIPLPSIPEQEEVAALRQWLDRVAHLQAASQRELMGFLAHVVSVHDNLFHSQEPSSEDTIKAANRMLRERAEKVRIAKADKSARNVRSLIEKLTGGEPWSLESIACALNDHNVPAPRGGIWSRAQVRRVLRRTDDVEEE